MRQYQQIITDLSTELNHKGRSKKGYNRQEAIIKLLGELKNNYTIELSTFFLKGLLNNDFTSKQKTQRIADTIRGIEKELRQKHSKNLEFVKYKKEVFEYGYKKGFEPYKAVLKSILVKIENPELPLFNAEIDTGKKELIGYNVVVRTYRTLTIGKEFFKHSKRSFCFLEI